MKKVFFDLMASQPDVNTKFHGGGEYIKTIFGELCNYTNNIELTVFYNPQCFLDDWIYEKIRKYNIKAIEVTNYQEITSFPEFQSADMFFAGLFNALSAIDFPENMQVIGVYHGFRSLEIPIDKTAPLYANGIKEKFKLYCKLLFKKQYYQYKYNEMKYMIKKCDIIIGVSKHSGYAAKMFFPTFDSNKVKVFYSPQKHVEIVEGIENIKTERMILMLGGNRWTKNVYRGIVALDELFSADQLKGYIVKIVGGISHSIRNKITNKERFIALGYLSAEDLEKTYKKCDLFFYPTLNEGFGYPPLEVMKYGKTCLISCVSSLPEVYKDSVYYCNPYDVNEMKTRLLQAVDEKINTKVIERNYQRITFKEQADLQALCSLIVS